jgi:phosphoglycolate phosphatase
LINLIWDIDGTLLSTRGLGANPFCEAFTEHTGCPAKIEKKKLSGFTDFEIALSLMKDAGIQEDLLLAEMILNTFSSKLQKILSATPPLILGDVLPTMKFVKSSKFLSNSIGSGNFLTGAIIKLKSAGLFEFFEESEFFVATAKLWNRDSIIESAAKANPEIRKLVIGDSPRDILSARHSHLPVLAVPTGQHSYDELQALKPNFILDANWKLRDFLKVIEEYESI